MADVKIAVFASSARPILQKCCTQDLIIDGRL